MNTLLEFKNVSFQVSHPQRTILHQIDYKVDKGDFIIILGSNGSGKSTLLKLIDQRYALRNGEILFSGKSLKNYSAGYLANNIVTLTQNTQESLFCTLTVLENCILAAERGKIKIARKIKISYFQEYLQTFNQQLANHLHNLAGSLSGGEQQALALALACLAKPKLLLLDEHTSALDPHAAEKLMQLTANIITEFGITCILTTHNLELAAKYGNRLLALQHGRIVQNYHTAEKADLSAQRLKEQCYEYVAE